MQARRIMHVDMDAYFASIEQAVNPMLKGRPLIVCGDAGPQKNYARTIVVTSSYEAREYGIKTGMTVPEAKRLCPNVLIAVGNHEKYIDVSSRIQKILLKYTDLVEVYSIDECFVDITGIKKEADVIAKEIKSVIKKELQLTCSIGVGPNKLIAKLAGDMNKPDGFTDIKQKSIDILSAHLPIDTLWGIGRQTTKKLNSLGIYSMKDLGQASKSQLKHYFGVLGYKLKEMGQGIDNTIVSSFYDKHDVKSVGHSYTMPFDTNDIDIIKSYLLMLCNKVSDRMMKYKLVGKTFVFSIRYADFSFKMKRMTIKEYTDNRWDIYHNALKIFKEFLPLKQKVRLLGVSVASVSESHMQKSLFSDTEKKEKLNKLVHDINNKYGDFFIKSASLLISENAGIKERCGLIGQYHFDKKK
ncbi:MAG: DNA polymerase IV [Elusimicrobiota bacterium]